ncbi:methyltransferase domain-containing protein [Lacticaseibacillus daqingensis]|uniref:methyltransferase domain-containing protein n=1 Tax=Lacticaseibacillus daqingensis TaxID=2486014 RepID=UPI000F775CB8|nr:methyltransferase domain-containing protein [Lacticaseibacillus daqingensis]
MNPNEIVTAMGLPASDPIQLIQTTYHVQITQALGVKPGMRVLEVGCGQGDMTAALAAAVGPTGHVTAYDIAAPDYGAPLTIGQAQANLAAGPLGARIDVHLQSDVLQANFAPAQFDLLVITHAAWYFPSAAAFSQLLLALAPAVQRIGIAEWSLALRDPQQNGHLLAVLIQAAYAAKRPDRAENIRTLITPAQLTATLVANGWACTTTTHPTGAMQDGEWEIALTRHDYGPMIEADATLTPTERAYLTALLATLDTQVDHTQALDAFILTAVRD